MSNEKKSNIKKWILLSLISLVLIFFIISSANKFMTLVLSMAFCSLTMFYKKYVAIDSLGIDFCLTFILITSSKYGFITGIIVSLSYAFGMIISLDITRNPATTMYGTIFYACVSLISSLLPLGFIYNAFIPLVIFVNVMYMVISLMIGGPITFLSIYTSTNAFANILLYRLFGGVLKMIF